MRRTIATANPIYRYTALALVAGAAWLGAAIALDVLPLYGQIIERTVSTVTHLFA